jgi:tetratricopeptide (TPR) repeat protein
MDWSYSLLRPGEQRLFELMAVFAESEIVAIEAVVADLGQIDDVALDVLDCLAGLIEKSLVRQVDEPGGEPRVAMLETIRAFATDRLEARPDIALRTGRAHATYFADRAAVLLTDSTGTHREAALADLGADVANLRIAWAYWLAEGDLERLDQLAGPLLTLDDAHGWYLDTVRLTQDLLAVLAAVPSSTHLAGQEIALRTTLARALMATKGLTPEVEAAFASALELFERGADVRQQYSVLRGLASLYLFRAQLDESGRLGREILALGEREGDPSMQIDGHLLIGTTLMTFDDLHGGLAELDQAIALFPTHRAGLQTARVRNDPRISCLTTAGFTLWILGYPDRAAERADAALTLAGELEHPFTTAYALFHAGLLRLWRRDSETALDLALRLRELSEEHGFRIWLAAGGVLLGAAQVQVGRFDEGLANIRAGIDLYEELRSPPIFWPFLLFLDARASIQAGRPADALKPLDTAIEILSPGVGASILPELHVLKGDLMAALADDPSPAEAWYRLAFDRARVLDARMAYLRAATRLARLRMAEGDPAAATGMLRPAYDTFTEGFETADLVEARELLADIEVT